MALRGSGYTVAVKGVQKFNITENLFGNQGLDYELLSGVKTARIGNLINAEKNYWGTSDIRLIRDRLFDFDDWNSYATTHFLPYLMKTASTAVCHRAMRDCLTLILTIWAVVCLSHCG